MRHKHIHIHALYLGSFLLAFVLGGVAISVPGLSKAKGIGVLSVGGNLNVGGVATILGDASIGGNLSVAGIITGNGSGLTNILPSAPTVVSNATVVAGTISALCGAGTVVTGGGCENMNTSVTATFISKPQGNGWLCKGTFAASPAAYAICIPAQ